jgi:hypothetical protein
MDYKNGYKVVYEVAADGERTFYASKSNAYPARDEDGKIIDTKLASFKDADYQGKVIYEYKGEFYVSTDSLPKYDENGIPTDKKIEGFDLVLKEAEETPASTEVEEPATPETPVQQDSTVDPEEVTEE